MTNQSPLRLYAETTSSPLSGERCLIPGPAGVLEAQLDAAALEVCPGRKAPVAVVCHPHPLHGGTLTNKVAHMVAKAFTEMGVATLRFNFRGVGESSGTYDQGVGEVDDLRAAVDWLRARHPQAPLWLAGFSFGAFVALRGQALAQAARLLLVAPPVAMFDFPAQSEVRIPWLLIQGSEDEIVDPDKVSAWAQQQVLAPVLYRMEGAGHFFHGRLIDLRQHIQTAWKEEICE